MRGRLVFIHSEPEPEDAQEPGWAGRLSVTGQVVGIDVDPASCVPE